MMDEKNKSEAEKNSALADAKDKELRIQDLAT